ncbi:MAG: PD40 domain-containing protein [Planctomycetes bacterium]|nr:PD40 domain-containing protein [Planctomycetota bacterium]
MLWLAHAKSLAAQEPRTLLGHTGPVQAVAFSPDGELLASCSNGPPARVMLWSTTTGELVSRLSTGVDNYCQSVHQLAFRGGGKKLVGCSNSYRRCGGGGSVAVWDIPTFRGRLSVYFPGRPSYIFAVSGDCNTIAMGTEADWDDGIPARTLEPAREPPQPPQVPPPFRSQRPVLLPSHPPRVPSEHRKDLKSFDSIDKNGPIAAWSFHHNLILWDLAAERVRAGAKFPNVFALALSPDGKTLAAGQRNRVVLLDASSLQPLDTIDALGLVAVMSFSHDGRMLATVPQSPDDPKSTGKSVSLWDISTGGLTMTFQTQAGPIRALAFSPRGRILATAGGVPDVSEIKLWDVESGELLTEFKGHDGPACCVAFSPDGRTLAWGGDGWTVRLWDLGYGLPQPGD